MLSETSTYIVIGLALLNAGLVFWVLIVVRPRATGAADSGLVLARFDGIDRNAEALRRELNQLAQALLAEVAKGARDGLAAAFDKVQEGSRAQAEQLARIHDAITQFGGNVQTKLSESETRAADGRAILARDTAEAIDRARVAIDASLKTFGEQQHERLRNAEQAVREGREAVDAASARTEKTLSEQREAITAQLTQSAGEIATRLNNELGQLAERVGTGFDGFSMRLRDEQEQLRAKVDAKLEEIRTGNEQKLEQMRRAVDEQLQSALEKRLNDGLKTVTEKFVQVQQAIGQVLDVTNQIGNLQRLFSNVKARGGWGEAHIQALLDDVLPPGAYETNLRIGEDGRVVEFALRMPLRHADDDTWLAIDAKFPTEDYDRMILASEAGDRDQESAARKALERRIRDEAKRIATRYISPPRTVEYALMYLPSEGLYSEVYRIPGLIETLRRQHAVMVMGPSVLPGLLHCIRVGHLTLALERKAGAIGEILSAVKAEWSKLGKALDAMATRAQSLSKGIIDAQKHNRGVGRALATVDALDPARVRQVLGLSEQALVIDAEPEDKEDAAPLLATPQPGSGSGCAAAE
ncbi:MAG TPA: DNA recombination protein RmuC [Stellaceae bacterium]|nr:DNA recombination protein RmuC [Stellaceae bacterium]